MGARVAPKTADGKPDLTAAMVGDRSQTVVNQGHVRSWKNCKSLPRHLPAEMATSPVSPFDHSPIITMSLESITRKEIINLRLKSAGWDVSDRTQVIEEFFISQSTDSSSATELTLAEEPTREFSDYVLLGKNGKPLAVVEAKKSSISAELGREQAKQYCLNIQSQKGNELPFCFYTNGHDIFFWNIGEAPPQKVKVFPPDRIWNDSFTFANTRSRSPTNLSTQPSPAAITSSRPFAP